MKRSLFFTTALLMPLMAFSTANNSRSYSGGVGKIILDAMKSAGVKEQSCKDGACVYSITDFYSAEEGDGCGGGTTSYDASFVYSDNTTYTYSYCEGSEYGEDQNPAQVQTNKAAALETILGELDYYENSGWTSSATIEKLECRTYKDVPNSAYCTVTTPEVKN